MTTSTALTPGTIVSARPWKLGREIEAQRGIVFTPVWGTDGEYALVWFPELGEPMVGQTVMPILPSKITNPATLADVPRGYVRAAAATVRRTRQIGGDFGWRPEWNAAADAIVSAARPAKTS